MPREKNLIILCMAAVIFYLMFSADESDMLKKLRSENNLLREKLAFAKMFFNAGTFETSGISAKASIKSTVRVYELKLYKFPSKDGNKTNFVDPEYVKKMAYKVSKLPPLINTTGIWNWELFPKAQLFWKMEARWLPDRIVFKSSQMVIKRVDTEKRKNRQRRRMPTGPERDSGEYLGNVTVSLDTSNLHL